MIQFLKLHILIHANVLKYSWYFMLFFQPATLLKKSLISDLSGILLGFVYKIILCRLWTVKFFLHVFMNVVAFSYQVVDHFQHFLQLSEPSNNACQLSVYSAPSTCCAAMEVGCWALSVEGAGGTLQRERLLSPVLVLLCPCSAVPQ